MLISIVYYRCSKTGMMFSLLFFLFIPIWSLFKLFLLINFEFQVWFAYYKWKMAFKLNKTILIVFFGGGWLSDTPCVFSSNYSWRACCSVKQYTIIKLIRIFCLAYSSPLMFSSVVQEISCSTSNDTILSLKAFFKY